ncbi:MAG: MFS transporter [Bacillota bacterium]|nr:MFS transporter [Bacillota bacterium]MDW7685348.1 MFS transporter [Bacillota bacterium]
MDKRQLNKMVLILGILVFLVQGDNFAATPLLVEIARDLNLTISKAALSVSAYMLPFGLFTLLFGPLSDRFGKARIINTAAFVTAVFSGLGAVAFNLTSLSIFRAVNGTFAAAIIPVTLALIGESFGDDPKVIQGALGRVMGLMFLGGAAAPAIVGFVSYIGSWRYVYLIYGTAELLMAGLMLLMLKKGPVKKKTAGLATTYRELFCTKYLVNTVLIVFLIGFSVYGSFTYAGKYIESVTGYNILLVGLLLTLFGIATVIGGYKVASIRQALGNRTLLLAGFLGLLFWTPLGFVKNPLLIALSLAGFGFGFILIHPTLVTTAQLLRPSQRGAVMSLVSFNLFVGGGMGVYVNGLLLPHWGYAAIFSSAGILLLIAGVAGTMTLSRIQACANQA